MCCTYHEIASSYGLIGGMHWNEYETFRLFTHMQLLTFDIIGNYLIAPLLMYVLYRVSYICFQFEG